MLHVLRFILLSGSLTFMAINRVAGLSVGQPHITSALADMLGFPDYTYSLIWYTVVCWRFWRFWKTRYREAARRSGTDAREVTINQSINQSIKKRLYSAVCHMYESQVLLNDGRYRLSVHV